MKKAIVFALLIGAFIHGAYSRGTREELDNQSNAQGEDINAQGEDIKALIEFAVENDIEFNFRYGFSYFNEALADWDDISEITIFKHGFLVTAYAESSYSSPSYYYFPYRSISELLFDDVEDVEALKGAISGDNI